MKKPQPLTQITFLDIVLPVQKNARSLSTGHWQGKVLDFIKTQEGVDTALFHNKSTEYPKVQYRNHKSCASIAGIGKEAVMAVSQFAEKFANAFPEQTTHTLQTTEYYAPKVLKHAVRYSAPFYLFPRGKRSVYTQVKKIWQEAEAVEQRLENNLYELIAKTLGFDFPKEFYIQLKGVRNPKAYYTYKKPGLFSEQGVTLDFECNLSLPKLGAIGTGKSRGYGIFNAHG